MRNALLVITLLLSYLYGFAGVRYTTHNLNLRSGPGTNHGILLTIPAGTSVSIDEDCDCKWIAVEYKGYIGYVSSKYLSNYRVAPKKSFSSGLYTTKRYYIKSAGTKVQSPTYYKSVPAGATAICRDGTYSFSRSRRGTCSHHGGVARWL